MTSPFELVVDALQKAGKRTQHTGGRVMAQCPAHEDRNPSLSVREGQDGKVLLYCFAGCQNVDIVAALGLSMRDLFTDRYEYVDTSGNRVREVRRVYGEDGRKTFRQSGIVGTPTLYRLPEVVAAVAAGEVLYLVEGEKDADALAAVGYTATTGPQGAGNFHLVDVSPLAGSHVVAVVDRDEAGKRWASTVADKLTAAGASVEFVAAKVGKDAADHVAAGYSVDDLEPWQVSPDATPTPEAPEGHAGSWEDAGLRSHQRLAARFATYAAGKVLYVDGLGWHHWDGTRWAPDPHDTHTNKLLQKLLAESWREAIRDRNLEQDVRASMTATGTAGVLSLASRDGRLFAEDVDVDPWLLNCRNGTLDLHDLHLRPHDPADRLTKITRAAYLPGATSPRWEEFLESSLPDVAVRAFLARYAGLALIGRVIEHVLVIATGTGRNGKGVLSGAVRNTLGDYAVTAPSSMLTTGRYGHSSASELAAKMILRGSRWVVMSELDKGDKMAEATMKFLTGGDSIPAKLMGQNYVEFRPSHSLFMLTNNLPEVDANDSAVWDRLRIVPFDVSFSGREDTRLEADLELQVDAILAWAVDGLRAYHGQGLGPPPAVTRRTAEYRSDNDPLRRFLEEECVLTPTASVPKGGLHEAFTQWAATARERPMSARAFGVLMKALPGVSETNSGARKWHGVGLAAEHENALDYGLQRKQQMDPVILTETASRESLGACVVSVVDPPPGQTGQTGPIPNGSHTSNGPNGSLETPRFCSVCGQPLHPAIAADGFTTCPACEVTR